jgi:hypothetical protein
MFTRTLGRSPIRKKPPTLDEQIEEIYQSLRKVNFDYEKLSPINQNKFNSLKTRFKETDYKFNDRLNKIGYDPDKVPLLFLCPISIEIMENPESVNGWLRNTFDKPYLDAHIKQNKEDPFNQPIQFVNRNIILKKETYDFVEAEIHFYYLEKKYLTDQTNSADKKINFIESIKIKISLIAEIKFLINFVMELIVKENKSIMHEHRVAEHGQFQGDKIKFLEALMLDEELSEHQDLINCYTKIHFYKKTLQDLKFRLLFMPEIADDIMLNLYKHIDDVIDHQLFLYTQELIITQRQHIIDSIKENNLKLLHELQVCLALIGIEQDGMTEEIHKIYKEEIDLLNALQKEIKETIECGAMNDLSQDLSIKTYKYYATGFDMFAFSEIEKGTGNEDENTNELIQFSGLRHSNPS